MCGFLADSQTKSSPIIPLNVRGFEKGKLSLKFSQIQHEEVLGSSFKSDTEEDNPWWDMAKELRTLPIAGSVEFHKYLSRVQYVHSTGRMVIDG